MRRWMATGLYIGLMTSLIVVGFSWMLSAQPGSQPSLQDALAQSVRQLGQCQSELGALRTLQADVISGKYLDLSAVKVQIEAVNPTFVFDVVTKKLSPKPEEKK